MRRLILHVAVMSACAAASVAELGRSPVPTALEVFPHTSFPVPGCDSGAPKTVLVFVAGDRDVWIGNEAERPARHREPRTILAELRRLKNERLDRETVVVEVRDGVAFSTLADLVDMMHGVGMRQISVITGAEGSQFNPDEWSRPDYRDLIPAPLEADGGLHHRWTR